MQLHKYLLSIDQGTSATKTLIFDEYGTAIAKGVTALQTNYMDNGFVEQDPEAILQNVLASVKECNKNFIALGHSFLDIAAIGITNQRETFVVWNKDGTALHSAVVWQCKRSISICHQLIKDGWSDLVKEKTGLVIDPYFSATKLMWLKQKNPDIAAAIANGDAYFGTIDTWLLYKFTDGTMYKTDYTNASRTLLFNLHTLTWDEALITAFGLEGVRFPDVQPSASFFGNTNLANLLPINLPITAMVGDSHAAAFGEGCFTAGTAKATLGTGCSVLMNVGNKPIPSTNGMVSTICWSTETEICYALEGVIVSCGATIEWLKNELQLFDSSNETAFMANSVEDNGGVYIVPAFSGLGSPYWQMNRKAAISGLTFNSNKCHIVRAALESIPYQIKDVLMAMELDAALQLAVLNIDGGITANDFVVTFLTHLLKIPVCTFGITDVSALGAAYLSGLQVGVYKSIDELKKIHQHKKVFQFANLFPKVDEYYSGWQKAIAIS